MRIPMHPVLVLALLTALASLSTFAADNTVTVSGTVAAGATPRANTTVTLVDLYPGTNPPRMAQTNAQGVYRFDAAPTGEILMGYRRPFTVTLPGGQTASSSALSHTRIVRIQAGKSYAINLGGAGRKVVGHFTAPPGASIVWSAAVNRVIASAVKRPAPPQTLSGAELDAWWNAYWRSSANAELEDSVQSIVLDIANDGAFAADDVPPGNYRLEVQFPGPKGSPDEITATVNRPFAVPDSSDATPLNLGAVPAVPVGKVSVGVMAPEFSVTTFDGARISLSALRGKYVLLNFWATWCEVCHEQFPLLQAIHAKWGADHRLVMVGISLDEDKATAAGDAIMKKATWPQALSGDPEKAGVAPQYGVYAVPEYFLIDPNGTILVAHCYDPGIQSAVDTALSR